MRGIYSSWGFREHPKIRLDPARPAPRTSVLSRRAPAEELAVSRFALEFAVFNDDLPSREHGFDHPTNPPAFIRAIVHAHVVGLCADGLLFVRVKDNDICIA